MMSYLYGWKTFYAEESENIKPFRVDYFVDILKQLRTEEISTKVNFENLINKLTILSTEEPIIKNNYELNNIKKEEVRKYAVKVIDMWIEAFKINKDILWHSDTEIKILDSYIYQIYVLLICKQSSNRVKQTTWSIIENELFLPC